MASNRQDADFQIGDIMSVLHSFKKRLKIPSVLPDQCTTESMYACDDLMFMSEVDRALLGKGRRAAYIMSIISVVALTSFLVWANFAVLDEVTKGLGKVIPSQRIQEIQNLEGGILSELFVTEGQVVQKDDILCRLHNEQAASYYRDAYAKSLENQAAIARLEAIADGKPPVFSDKLRHEAAQLIEDQQSIYDVQMQKHEIDLDQLRRQYDQKRQEIDEMRSRKRQLTESLKVALEKRDIAKPLLDNQNFSRMDYLALEQRVVELRGDIESLSLSIPRAQNAAQESLGRIQQAQTEFRSKALEEINRRRLELSSLTESLSSGSDRVTRTDVRSAVRGIVKHIMVNTIGGVIRPGQSIMEIVPLDDTLLIEARVRLADIAFLHPDQRAMVKITAYDFSIYGGLEGKVENISADTIADDKGESYYLVKVRTDKNTIVYRNEALPIIPGMTAQVDVLTGKKSVLDYLLKPILKAKQNALRER